MLTNKMQHRYMTWQLESNALSLHEKLKKYTKIKQETNNQL